MVDIRFSNGYRLWSDERQWNVAKVDDREETKQEIYSDTRTFHTKLSDALKRLLMSDLKTDEVISIGDLARTMKRAYDRIEEIEEKMPTLEEIYRDREDG